MLETFLTRGHAADLILLLVLAEGLLLWLRHRRGQGAPLMRWLSPLLAGAALVLTLRLAQTGAPAEALGALLAVAGVAHLMGYRERWFG